MKKAFALLLAVLLVLSPVVQAQAAAPQEQTLTLTRVMGDDVLPASGLLEAMAQDEEYPNVMIYPDPTMYGMTVVRGNDMSVEFHFINESGSNLLVAVEIYKGTLDEIDDNDEPVAYAIDQMMSYTEIRSDILSWDTSDLSTGDYTILFALADMNGNILTADYCDVYLSDREIPLEKLSLYVYELDKQTGAVFTDTGKKEITVDVVRTPYHTTNRSAARYSAPDLHSGANDNFIFGDSFELPGKSGTFPLTAYVNEGSQRIETSMNIYVSDTSEKLVRFELDELSYLCYDYELPIGVSTPSGVGSQDCLYMTSNPLIIGGRLTNSGINVYAISETTNRQSLVVSYGATNSYDALTFHVGSHDYETDVVKQPTCSEDGLEVTRCLVCGYVLRETVLPGGNGHDFGETGAQVIQEPTATKPGYKEGYCSICQQTVQEILPQVFVDTDAARYYSDAVDYCYETGLVNGITSTTFAPDMSMTRAQLVTMLYRYAGSPEVSGDTPFEDVEEGRFYTDAVKWAYENQVVNGVTDTTFAPGNVCTRQQFVTILFRYAVANGLDNGERADLSGYTDADEIGAYAKEAFAWAVANGIINGMTPDTVVPNGEASRAQAATMLYRYIQHIESLETEEPVDPEEPTDPTDPTDP